MQPRIVEPLVCSYGAFRVRQLILEIDGRESRTLEVCRLTLADDPEREVPLKTVDNLRTDLPWIVYAVEEYLDNLTRYIRQLDNERYEHADPERLAEALRQLSTTSDEEWARLIAQGVLMPHPRQRELMGIIHRRVSAALRDVKASHSEGIPAIIEGMSVQHPELVGLLNPPRQSTLISLVSRLKSLIFRLFSARRRRTQYQADARPPSLHQGRDPQEVRNIWRSQLGGPLYKPLLGELVLQAGPFRMFEELGFYTLSDVFLYPLPLEQREEGTSVDARYTIYFQSDGFDESVVGSLTLADAPGASDVCEAVRRWITDRRESNEEESRWNREWKMQERHGLKQEVDSQTYAMLEQENETLEDHDEMYQSVYGAWLALGCSD